MFIFAAYASSVSAVDAIMRSTAAKLRQTKIELHPWPENDIVGRPLIEPILDNIEKSDLVICDLTALNFNVVFEAGFAIAKNKRVIFVINDSVSNDVRHFAQIGIFDTLGFEKYSNTDSLVAKIIAFNDEDKKPLFTEYNKNIKNPVYIVELPKKLTYKRA